MNIIDIHNMIERAKTNAREFDKLSADNPLPESDLEVDDLMDRAEGLLEDEETIKSLDKRASADRASNLVIAKLLAAVDVFSEVSR